LCNVWNQRNWRYLLSRLEISLLDVLGVIVLFDILIDIASGNGSLGLLALGLLALLLLGP
jgi:hypothetical protein